MDPDALSAPPPPARTARAWGVAAAQSLGILLATLVTALLDLGFLLEDHVDQRGNAMPTLPLTLWLIAALVGLLGSLAIGPLRFVRTRGLVLGLYLLIAAAMGVSISLMPVGVLALYRVGQQRRLPLDILATSLVVGAAGAQLGIELYTGRAYFERPVLSSLGLLGVIALFALVPLLMGRTDATRRLLLLSLQERAAAADREIQALRRGRDAEVARLRAEERSALARDMHDSLSHHLSAIAMHAGAMTYRQDLPPATLQEAAGTVRDAAQEANRELREVLVALRADGADPTAPLATVPTLEETVERARETGQDVTCELDGLERADLGSLGRSTVVTLSRILGEALANAAKHAPEQAVHIRFARGEERLTLQVTNPVAEGSDPSATPVLSTGHGLVGVQERARLLGGDACWGVHQGEFRMEAWMPW
ncbi:histidine kinase [Brachybacterium sp. UMB0905]|uniref:sensor histidine kinase n=1 Tax=Brachybacterium sp. UMB0905 TaxID=2069310 RepID=UPI00130454AA|nr:histidine kinase [Brachybacterium sp. UMB0905]